MNVVKLKDIIKPGDGFYNKYLKGKYAWWVHMRYIIPFEKMGVHGYIACEENIQDLFRPPYKTEFRDVYCEDMWPYIDQTATDEANNINIFKMNNSYAPDSDITADEVKKFRTWLATELLKFDQNNRGEQLNALYTSTQTMVLQYYMNNMYDEAIHRLSIFNETEQYQIVNNNQCGCGSSSDLSSLTVTTACDPLSIYREGIRKKMIDMFSDMTFWMQFNKGFISEFKKYIDNIISMNLVLVKTEEPQNVFADCTCMQDTENDQTILHALSKSLQYIIDDKTAGHKNYISDSLYKWSVLLYENMQW